MLNRPILDMDCPVNMVYQACVSECQPTCADKTGADCMEDETCEEGCACIEGYVYDGETCVRPDMCGCQWNDWFYMVSKEDRLHIITIPVCGRRVL